MSGISTPPNALDVLLSALPSTVAASFSAVATNLSPATSTRTANSQTTSRASRPTISTAVSTFSTSQITSTTSSIPRTASASPTSTFAAAADQTSHAQLSDGAIAGLTVGIVAAFVFLSIFVFILVRHSQQGGCSRFPIFFSRRFPCCHRRHNPDSPAQNYPEVAYLYDPDLGPRASPRRGVRKKKSELPLASPESAWSAQSVEVPRPLFADTRTLDRSRTVSLNGDHHESGRGSGPGLGTGEMEERSSASFFPVRMSLAPLRKSLSRKFRSQPQRRQVFV